MEEEDTRNYKEPCPQCSEVNWGISDEGKFYCKCCHTVIEKTREVDETGGFLQNGRVQSVAKGLKKAKKEQGREWYICEGFQFILLKQAEALESLEAGSQIKEEAVCNLWRRYLQKTKQAYCTRPPPLGLHFIPNSQGRASSSEVDSELDVLSLACPPVSDGELYLSNYATSPGYTSESAASVFSGSTDGGSYKLKKKSKDSEMIMTMPMTLAFCYLSLLWVRASITLSDLLRLAFYGHVPYFSPEQYLPEQMKVQGADLNFFDIQFFPVYRQILEMSHELGVFLDLPIFPPITETSFYHPNVLCMKYLMEVNLPDELHSWTYWVAKKAGLNDVTYLTYDPAQKKAARNIPYDIQAVAVIIVALKLLFCLDDGQEWRMATLASKRNKENQETATFDFKKWYETVKPRVDEAQQKLDEDYARFSWKGKIPLCAVKKHKSVVMKRKEMEHNLQRQFSKLTGVAPDAGNRDPSRFLFNWDEPDTDTICFHGHSLQGLAQEGKNLLSGLRTNYWLGTLKKCTNRFCKHWKLYDESKFSKSYHFVLSLFCLVLRVEHYEIHHEVCLVEEKLFKDHLKHKK